MALAPRLEIKQTTSLVMTPQLQQAIRLLTLNNLELESAVLAEVEANPFLEVQSGELQSGEREDGGAAGEAEEGSSAAADSEARTDDSEPATADQLIQGGDAIRDAPLDADYWEGSERNAESLPFDSGSDGEGYDIDGFAEQKTTLGDHLLQQATTKLTGVNLAVARYLIDLVDDAGYFRGDLVEVAETLGVTSRRAEAILKLIQGFDPTGVGARSIAECLELQAREARKLDRPMRQLIRNLDALARGEFVTLRRICRVTSDELHTLIRTLRTFNPKPGSGFGPSTMTPVAPDVFIARTAKGWAIELNGATMPRVLVNRGYHAELVAGARGAEKQFLSDAIHSANWLTKALDQRARTIVRVVTEIVRQQEGFFEHGVSRLRPLNLRAVADVVGLHESTVSRVTSNKYLSCERGVFELKYFFTPALALVSADGGEISTEAVKRRIRELIDAESPDEILSDDKLVELLRGEGFDVARRTVAKYREAMHIGSSVQRRRKLALSI